MSYFADRAAHRRFQPPDSTPDSTMAQSAMGQPAWPLAAQGAMTSAVSTIAEPVESRVWSSKPFWRGRVARKHVVNMTSQLAIMCQSGIDVAAALESLARQCRISALKEALERTHEDVINGASLSQALSHSGHLFDDCYVASVAAGEASGCLPEVLAQLAQLQRGDLRLRSAVRSMLVYPCALTVVSATVLLGLVLFVLPQFAKVFADNGMPLPAITQMLIQVSSELRSRFWFWAPAALICAGAAVAFRFSGPGRVLWDRLVLRARFVGEVSQTLLIGRICRLLGVLLQSGVPLVESLRLAQKAVGNSEYRKFLRSVEEDVINGRGLRDAFLSCAFVPAGASEMIVTAEQTGNLGPVARLIGEYFEEEAQTRLKDLITLLEPAITVGMGLVVALVVLAVVLPMFDMASFASHN